MTLTRLLKNLLRFLAGIEVFYFGMNIRYLDEVINNNFLMFFISAMVWLIFYGLLHLAEELE